MLSGHIALYAFDVFTLWESIEYHMLFKGCPLDFAVQDKPQLHVRVPSAFRRLHGCHQVFFSESDPQGNKIAVAIFFCLRLPRCFLNAVAKMFSQQ
jgi:hypothetical protein